MAGVTSSYPAALDSESNLTPPNNGDTLSVADHWLAGNAGPIVAIETELGTDPAGTFTDVKSRLDSGLTTEVDMWKLTSSFTPVGTSPVDITGVTRYWADYKGSGMTQSSGVFEFPSTGYYLIGYNTSSITSTTGGAYVGGYIVYSTDGGSSYNSLTGQLTAGRNTNDYVSTSGMVYIPVLNTSNYRVKFQVQAAVSTLFTQNLTNMTFIKLGDL